MDQSPPGEHIPLPFAPQLRPRALHPGRRLLALATLSFCATLPAAAQAREAARRTNELSAFATVSAGRSGYFPDLAAGLTLGVDYTAHLTRFFAADLGLRANRVSNNRLIERSVLIGPELRVNLIPRLHPYAGFFLGGGTIVFLDPSVGYHEDRSKVYSYGGGLDLDLSPHFAVKLDLQRQLWNIGPQDPGGPDFTFAPYTLGVGLRYSLPFGPQRRNR